MAYGVPDTWIPSPPKKAPRRTPTPQDIKLWEQNKFDERLPVHLDPNIIAPVYRRLPRSDMESGGLISFIGDYFETHEEHYQPYLRSGYKLHNLKEIKAMSSTRVHQVGEELMRETEMMMPKHQGWWKSMYKQLPERAKAALRLVGRGAATIFGRGG